MYKIDLNKKMYNMDNYEYVYNNIKKCYVYGNKLLPYVEHKPYTEIQINKINELNKKNFITEATYWGLFQEILND